jgi:hypothetical protein
MPVTNDDIMRKLDKIEAMLNNISKQEDQELAEEKKIEEDEEKELSEISESAINLEFANIEDWRRYIWDTCPFRKEQSKKGEVDFFCKKQNAPCRFDGCPLNYKMEPKK